VVNHSCVGNSMLYIRIGEQAGLVGNSYGKACKGGDR
jgi:hypothetical protein